MDITQIYAVAAGGALAFLVIVKLWLSITRFLQLQTYGFVLKHVVYPYLLRRHRYIGPWTRGSVLLHVFYITAVIFCTSYRVDSLTQASIRAGNMSLINTIPLYLGFHLGFIADVLGISLRVFSRLHGSIAVISAALGLFHAVVSMASGPSRFHDATQRTYGLAGLSSSLALLILSSKIFRQAFYETFLRSHQGLAIFYLYTIWRHIAPGTLVSRVYLLTAAVIFSVSSLSQSVIVIARNYSPGQGCGRALVTRINDAVRIRIRVSRRLKVRAGQYLNIWMPTLDFRSTLQSHPFMIASWTECDPIYLELLIKPESSFTNRLLKNAIKHFEPEQAQSAGHDHLFTNHETWVIWYSGPHGSPEPVGDYGSVLIIATGFGIAAQIPILQELVRGHSSCTVRTRRLHLVWQLDSWGDHMAGGGLLDEALFADHEDGGYILRISMYFANGHQAEKDPSLKSRRNRVSYHDGFMDVKEILTRQLAGQYEVQEEGQPVELIEKARGRLLVAVSARDSVRDTAREIVSDYSNKDVRLWEPDYQPSSAEPF